jgi:hypothetical protein
MRFAVIFLAILFIIPGATTLYAEIYTWTDDNGVKHYSNTPPPADVKAEVKFNEYQSDDAADQKRTQSDKQELQALIKEIEAEEARQQAEQKRKEKEAEANKPPSEEELVEAETQRLTEKIVMLEARPLDYFGSQRNKIITIGFYKYRLEELLKDPKKYFKNPVKFEGNVKYSEHYKNKKKD